MTNPLLDRVLPSQLARRSKVIEIQGKLKDFERLAAIVEGDLASLAPPDRPQEWRDARVGIRLGFGFVDAAGAVPAVEGQVTATLDAVCQRCLEACALPLEAPVRFLLLEADAHVEGYPEYEIWELSEKTLLLQDVVEEALIMAMPLSAVHATMEQCGPLARVLTAAPTGTVRPFAGLKGQLDEAK